MQLRRVRANDELQPLRDQVCLDAYNHLWSIATLAEWIGKSRVTIWRWVKRAKENQRPPDLEIWMNGVGKACIHHRPIVPGMPVICLDCVERLGTSPEVTGMPEHPAFRRVKYSPPPAKAPKSKLAGVDADVVFVKPAGPTTGLKPKRTTPSKP